MDVDHLPIIDWELARKLAGNKMDLADDILLALLAELPTTAKQLYNLHSERKYTDLIACVHKLHGALCYSGLPRLKSIVLRLETDLKSNIMVNSLSLIEQLDTEIRRLQEHHPLQR